MPKNRTAEEIAKEVNRLVAVTKSLTIMMSGLTKSVEAEKEALISRTERIKVFQQSLTDGLARVEREILSLQASLFEGTTFGIKRNELDEFLRELVKLMEADIAVLTAIGPIAADSMGAKLGILTSKAKGFRRKISVDKKG